ncbi:uncharacterized protein LOC132546928 [Ylistrum balloti]|uniref:uncharacterized protein LOC132546928 n=1 Tax=Ylistrum balloti TaxID=509963 RepID=UPI002905A47F|nr:uncharacterized protein LOC132546928 [Ylistrum balloti]
MDTRNTMIGVCAVWTLLFSVHIDVCSAARSGGSSSRTGSVLTDSESAGFVGGPDTSSPSFIIFMMIFAMCVLAVGIFLIIMCCKIRRYCCYKHSTLSGSHNKQNIDSQKGSSSWSTEPDPSTKKPDLPPSSNEDTKMAFPSILKKEKENKPQEKSFHFTESVDPLPPILTLPYPASTGSNYFNPSPEPELSDSYSESDTESAIEVD